MPLILVWKLHSMEAQYSKVTFTQPLLNFLLTLVSDSQHIQYYATFTWCLSSDNNNQKATFVLKTHAILALFRSAVHLKKTICCSKRNRGPYCVKVQTFWNNVVLCVRLEFVRGKNVVHRINIKSVYKLVQQNTTANSEDRFRLLIRIQISLRQLSATDHWVRPVKVCAQLRLHKVGIAT